MMIGADGNKPIYIQISDWIENEILNGNFREDEKVCSQYKLAEIFNINPATAAKGLNLLSDEEILYNKRGLGKFVSREARALILDKRKNQTLKGLVRDTVIEAERLDVSTEELIDMIKAVTKIRKGDAE
ncbi:GntR family transcriptional regulator [Virgibacillus kekensis]|uniref:GntR family transcriptional regulator n=1 Tax=Virgibacillus kekensis TaxID=202261 RepID=A0ABV9DNZ4_9BACI